jgi:hypothetical protein
VEGILSYTLFAPGSIEGIPGEFPGNTVVYIDEKTREVLKVAPIGTPFIEEEATSAPQKPARKAQPAQGEALPDDTAKAQPDAASTMGG